jgi:hypothetical protein
MTRRRPLAIPAIIAAGIRRAEKERRAAIIARPMRDLMDMLKQGEVYEIDGRAVMRMPEIDAQFSERTDWCEIAPAIEAWRDCWQRIAPDISTYYMGVLAARLRDDKPLTPRMVEKARAELDATVSRIPEIEDGKILSAVRTAEIAWEMEKLQKQEAADEEL